MKFATFVERPNGMSEAAFRSWFTENYLHAFKAVTPNLRGALLRFAKDFGSMPLDSAAKPGDSEFLAVGAILETWFSSDEDFRREALTIERHFDVAECRYFSCAVTPRLQKDARISEAGSEGRRPEVTAIVSLLWKDAIAAGTASEHYDRHAAIALRAQKGWTKYEQNLVHDVISCSRGVHPVDAYADLSFPDAETVRQTFVVTQEEVHDTSAFIKRARCSYFPDAQPVSMAK